jgi:hypothetical protein
LAQGEEHDGGSIDQNPKEIDAGKGIAGASDSRKVLGKG